ncbi:hypothetical protein LTR10_002312 [Elasticomyces elasticus]|nr:hypothetical protein LTR10_002312 [Elasticomyces elasticus]KAK4973617.1 hypothetical protein LTR42_005606 [Elasticomyces elasticus]
MPPLKLFTTAEAAIARTLEVVELHSPTISPVHHEAATEEPISSRSSYYVPSPVREAVDMDMIMSQDYDDTKSLATTTKSKRSIISKLKPSRNKPAPSQTGSDSHGKSDRLRSFTKFKGFFAGPELSLAANARKAAEERKLGERSMHDGRTWLML